MADFRLRVTYVEKGRLVMLSHLEVARALERAVRRADLPFAVTQGFSPHMKQAFGAALPVGVGGMCEIFDVSLTEYVPPMEALKRLQAVSAEDLMPVDACYITKDDAAASVAYPICTYEAVIGRVGQVGEGAAEEPLAEGLTMPEEIRIVRKKKEKVLCPADFLIGEMKAEGNRLTFTLESKDTGSLRPDVLLEAMLEGTGLCATSIMRVAQAAKPEAPSA